MQYARIQHGIVKTMSTCYTYSLRHAVPVLDVSGSLLMVTCAVRLVVNAEKLVQYLVVEIVGVADGSTGIVHLQISFGPSSVSHKGCAACLVLGLLGGACVRLYPQVCKRLSFISAETSL